MASAAQVERFQRAEPIDRVRAIEQGLSARMLRVAMTDKTVTLADLARVVAPRRTLDRRLKENDRLSVEESDRFARFLSIVELTMTVFTDRAESMRWLREPKHAFDGQVPLDLLRTGTGARIVEERLLQLKHGFFA